MANATRTIQLNILGDGSKATAAMDQVGAKSESVASRASKAFSGMLSSLSQGGMLGPLGEALDQVSQAFDALAEKGKGVGQTLMGVGAAGVGAGALLLSASSQDQAAHQQLQAAVEATGKSYDDYSDQIDSAIKSQEKFGNTANQTQNALQILTQATGDPAKALQYLSTASDLAAAKHESLSSAATQLGKTYNGATKLLKDFNLEAGPKATVAAKQLQSATSQLTTAQDNASKAQQKLNDLEAVDHTKKTLTVADQLKLRDAQQAVADATTKVTAAQTKVKGAQDLVNQSMTAQGTTMDQLSAKLKGQASAAADTFTGHLRALKAEVEDHIADFGQKYGPAITSAGAAMTLLGGATDVASGIFEHFRTAQEAATGATEAMSVAEDESAVSEGLALGPILLIIAAVALLGVGIYELVTHWTDVWNAIKQVVGDVVTWVQAHWGLLLDILIGPFGLFIKYVVDNFAQIENTVITAFNGIITFLASAANEIIQIGNDIGKGIANGFIWGINNIIAAWDWLAGALKIPGFSVGPVHFGGLDLGSALKIGQVPYLAAGGIAVSPTLAVIGESGPEAVVPLNSAAAAGFGGGGQQMTGDVYIDGQKAGQVLWRPIRDQLIRSGRDNPSVLSGFSVRA